MEVYVLTGTQPNPGPSVAVMFIKDSNQFKTKKLGSMSNMEAILKATLMATKSCGTGSTIKIFNANVANKIHKPSDGKYFQTYDLIQQYIKDKVLDIELCKDKSIKNKLKLHVNKLFKTI